MSCKSRQYQESSDYPVISHWWRAHNWPPVPQQYLPQTGYVVEFEEKPICVGFLYKTDSKFAWLEWVVSDPSSDKIVRNQALDCLLETLTNEAGRLGFGAIHTSARHPGLIERYQKHGFSVSDTEMTNLTRVGE